MVAPSSASWGDTPQRPLQPVLQCRVPAGLERLGHQIIEEPKSELLGQCPDGKLLGRLKTASVHGHKFATRAQARPAVMDWMAFYNHRRSHSSLSYLSPMQYKQRWYEAQRKKAA